MSKDGRRHESLSVPEWSVRESVTEYETGWYTGGYDRVEQPDGSTKNIIGLNLQQPWLLLQLQMIQ